jgi:hypothetical protein
MLTKVIVFADHACLVGLELKSPVRSVDLLLSKCLQKPFVSKTQVRGYDTLSVNLISK